jgi:hypothetical protein
MIIPIEIRRAEAQKVEWKEITRRLLIGGKPTNHVDTTCGLYMREYARWRRGTQAGTEPCLRQLGSPSDVAGIMRSNFLCWDLPWTDCRRIQRRFEGKWPRLSNPAWLGRASLIVGSIKPLLLAGFRIP